MERVMCAKGHFYDAASYSECPHCAAGMPAAVPSAFVAVKEVPREAQGKEKTEEKRRLFSQRKNRQGRGTKKKGKQSAETTEDRRQILSVNMQESMGGVIVEQGGAAPGRGPYPAQSNASRERISDANATEVLFRGPAVLSYGEDFTQKLGGAFMAGTDGKSVKNPSGETERGYQNSTPESSVERIAENTESRAAGNNLKAAGQDEGRTIGFFSVGDDREPPVGYLICIEGEDYGTGFPLKSGSNSLGRSRSMDVMIMDAKVSREKQAYVMYEPHKRDFFLKPGDSGGLCYLNDELVLEPRKLQAYDMLLLGDTKLMLIPVCGEKFSW